MPVDTYTGGIEHATMHLIYTRFFHKACRDIGIVQGDEPMRQLRNQGIVLGADSEKMSKSRGNVVAPDELVDKYGADTVRAYLMFFARWELGGPWNSRGIEGAWRWLRRVWAFYFPEEGAAAGTAEENPENPEATARVRRKLHQTLRQVTGDFVGFSFNTIVAALMELTNLLYKQGATDEAIDALLLLMAPMAPHVTAELWERRNGGHIHAQAWPEADPDLVKLETVTMVVQVNGKLRDRVTVPAGIGDEEAKAHALATEGARKFLSGLTVRKVILVPGRLVNIVAG